LSARGHQVTVITSRRGYDDPDSVFVPRERWQSIDIVRIPSLAAGKRRRWQRAVNFASYLFACAARLAVTPRADIVIALTSPPLISWLGSLFVRIRGGRLIFWPLDLNPDEAIAAGWLRENSLSAWWLARLLLSSMKASTKIIALDEYMKKRIVAKGISPTKIEVIPPSPDDSLSYDGQGREQFRRAHRLTEKYVVMYAGNHSPCHPLDTLLTAARKLSDRDDIVFVFVGGGSEIAKVKSLIGAANVRWLPYQPQEKLSELLSAADVHVVIMGDRFSGIVHPSKIYNVLKINSPLLYIGPRESFITNLINRERKDMTASALHGDVDSVVEIISTFADRVKLHSRSALPPARTDDGFARFVAQIETLATPDASAVTLETVET
jgi:glycosyltransferase involved in cell wall biosynthesis